MGTEKMTPMETKLKPLTQEMSTRISFPTPRTLTAKCKEENTLNLAYYLLCNFTIFLCFTFFHFYFFSQQILQSYVLITLNLTALIEFVNDQQ